MSMREIMAQKLKEFRIISGLSQIEVGRIIGKSCKTISSWEHGRTQPDADTLVILCKIYNVKCVCEFFNQNDNVVPLTATARKVGCAYDQATLTIKRIVDTALEPYFE